MNKVYLYLSLSTSEKELSLSTTKDGAKLLQSLVVSAVRDAGISQVKWKISTLGVMASLMEDFTLDSISEVEKWINIKDSSLVEGVIEELYWAGEVSLVREM